MMEAVGRATPRWSATAKRQAPGWRVRKASTRNWGTERCEARWRRISPRRKRITKGTASITARAQVRGVTLGCQMPRCLPSAQCHHFSHWIAPLLNTWSNY